MAWARLDDRWHDHPKVAKAGLEAAGLWVMCLTWAHQASKTAKAPGVVPTEVITRFAGGKGKRIATRLHDVGLFDAETPDGWPIHDYAEYLPKYSTEQAKAAGSAGGRAKAKNRTASKPLSKPLDGSLSEPVANGVAVSSTRASVRRNPDPEPEPKHSAPSEPLASASTEAVHAGTVIGAWVDACKANGVSPSESQRKRVGKTAKELLRDNDPELVMAAAAQAGAKGYPSIDRELTAMNGRVIPRVGQQRPTSEGYHAGVSLARRLHEREQADQAAAQLSLGDTA